MTQIPGEVLERFARAAQNNEAMMTIVLSNKVMFDLTIQGLAMLELDDESIIFLLTETAAATLAEQVDLDQGATYG